MFYIHCRLLKYFGEHIENLQKNIKRKVVCMQVCMYACVFCAACACHKVCPAVATICPIISVTEIFASFTLFSPAHLIMRTINKNGQKLSHKQCNKHKNSFFFFFFLIKTQKNITNTTNTSSSNNNNFIISYSSKYEQQLQLVLKQK